LVLKSKEEKWERTKEGYSEVGNTLFLTKWLSGEGLLNDEKGEETLLGVKVAEGSL